MPAVAEDLAKVLKFSLETKTSLRLQFEAIEAQVITWIITDNTWKEYNLRVLNLLNKRKYTRNALNSYACCNNSFAGPS